MMNTMFYVAVTIPIIAYFGIWFLARDTKKMIKRNLVGRPDSAAQFELVEMNDLLGNQRNLNVPIPSRSTGKLTP